MAHIEAKPTRIFYISAAHRRTSDSVPLIRAVCLFTTELPLAPN